jgi:hypothetical protein
MEKVMGFDGNVKKLSSCSFLLFLIAIMIFSLSLKIGYRDISIGTDFQRYFANYAESLSHNNFSWQREVGYEALVFLGTLIKLPPGIFFAFLASLNMILNYCAFLEISNSLHLSKKQTNAFIFVAFLFFIVSPFTWNSLINIIKHGLAAPFLIIGFSLCARGRYIRAFMFFFFSIIFHNSSIFFIAIGITIIMFKINSTIIAFILAILYLLRYTTSIAIALQNITGIPIYTAIISYANYYLFYKTGYRNDFLLFSMLPLVLTIIFCFMVPSFKKNVRIRIFKINHIYSILIIPFLLVGYGSFMDRWLVPAWSFLPIYPALLVTWFSKKSLWFPVWCGVSAIFAITMVYILKI